MASSTATGLAITNPLVKYRALIATKAIAPDPVGLLALQNIQAIAESRYRPNTDLLYTYQNYTIV